MEPLVHPSELSIWQVFLQARRLNRETSRSKNPDWYKSPAELTAQLHLFVEGDAIVRASFRSRTGGAVVWADVEAPSLEESDDGIKDYFATIFGSHLKKKHRSLGVILHLADEFAISELASFSEAPEDYNELRERLQADPREVIEDHSVTVDDLSFRLMPYRGQDKTPFAGVAITVSRKHHEMLRQFRICGEQANFPVRTTALSAPLEVLGALPTLIKAKPERPFCTLFAYQDFSVAAFFNKNSELALLRSIRHHSGGIPGNAHVIVQTMAVSLELTDPTVYLLCLSQREANGLNELTGAETLDWRADENFGEDLPLEFQLSKPTVAGADEEELKRKPLSATLTFADFAEHGWLTQDFLSPTIEEQQLHPSALEMKILSWGKIGVRAGVAVLALFILFLGVRAVSVMRDPAWHNSNSGSANAGNTLLQNDINKFKQWDAFLEDRSKAWVTMELIVRIFPDPSAVTVTEITHTARPEAVRDLAKISIVKDWTITGYANDNALDQLTALNTREGINAAFKNASEVTGDSSLIPDLPSRNLVVNLLASENKRYDPEKGIGPAYQFPFQFTLTISQRLSTDDPLAIPAAAAP